MKKINKNTILKQGEKTYQPVEVDGIIYWVDRETQIIGNNFTHIYNPHHNDIWALDVNQISIAQAEGDRLEFGGGGVVAQSQLKLEGIPVISLNKYVERLAEKEWKNVNRTFWGLAKWLNPMLNRITKLNN